MNQTSAEWGLGFFVSLLVLAIGIGIVLSIVFWSLKNGITPTPTSFKARRSLSTLLPKEVDGTIFELGSGFGSLLFLLAKRYPEHRIIGYETSTIPYWFSRLRQLIGKYPNVEIWQGDFFEANLGSSGLVVCYLFPGAMLKLKEKFEKELKRGTFVISNTFSIPGWQASEIKEVGDLFYTKIFLYQIDNKTVSLLV